jgi:hypothetical protein
MNEVCFRSLFNNRSRVFSSIRASIVAVQPPLGTDVTCHPDISVIGCKTKDAKRAKKVQEFVQEGKRGRIGKLLDV